MINRRKFFGGIVGTVAVVSLPLLSETQTKHSDSMPSYHVPVKMDLNGRLLCPCGDERSPKLWVGNGIRFDNHIECLKCGMKGYEVNSRPHSDGKGPYMGSAIEGWNQKVLDKLGYTHENYHIQWCKAKGVPWFPIPGTEAAA